MANQSADPWAEFRIAPQGDGAQTISDPWAEFRLSGAPKPNEPVGYMEDMAKTVPSGLVRGAVGAVTGVDDLTRIMGNGVAEWAAGGKTDILNPDFTSYQAPDRQPSQDWLSRGLRYIGLDPDPSPEFTRRAQEYDALSPEEKRRRFDEGQRSVENAYGLKPDQIRRDLPGFLGGNGETLTQRAIGDIEQATGPLYHPQTVPGQYVNTAAEFAPASLLGGGSLAQRAAQVAIPAATSETAGQIAHAYAPELEGYARIAGGLAGGIGTAVAQVKRGANAVASEALQGITKAEVEQAGALMEAAANSATPVRLTFDEALNQVTGGRAQRLSQVRRVAENSDGGQALRDVTAARPGEVKAAGQAEINKIAPEPYPPQVSALRAQQAAGEAVDDARQLINNSSRPYYKASEHYRLPPEAWHPIQADPAFAESYARLYNDRVMGQKYFGHAPDSIGVIDAVTKDMQAQAQKARNVNNALFGPEKAAEYEASIARARGTARDPLQGGSEAYHTALKIQSDGRKQLLEPLEAGPIGQIAKADAGAENASAMMGRKLAGAGESDRYHPVLTDSVKRLAKQDRRAAETIARDYIADTFNKNIADLQGGANPYGGANFRAALIGTPAQEANLKAMVTALPRGDIRWQGLQKFLDIAEATGFKPQKGSDTAFNAVIQDSFKETGVFRGMAEGATQAALGGSIGRFSGLRRAFMDRIDRYKMGKNVEEFANLLTNTRNLRRWNDLVKAPEGSNKALAAAFRLLYIGQKAHTSGSSIAGPR